MPNQKHILNINKTMTDLVIDLLVELRIKVKTDSSLTEPQRADLRTVPGITDYLNKGLRDTLDAILQPCGYSGSITWDMLPTEDYKLLLHIFEHHLGPGVPIAHLLNQPISNKFEIGTLVKGDSKTKPLFYPFEPARTIMRVTPLVELPDKMDESTLHAFEPILENLQRMYRYVDAFAPAQWSRFADCVCEMYGVGFQSYGELPPHKLSDLEWRAQVRDTVAEMRQEVK
jgi:hypothetical protein